VFSGGHNIVEKYYFKVNYSGNINLFFFVNLIIFQNVGNSLLLVLGLFLNTAHWVFLQN
jgi:hypothetical protein